MPKNAGEQTIEFLDKIRHSKGPYSSANIRREMQKTMQKHAAVFRVQKTLEEGLKKIKINILFFRM